MRSEVRNSSRPYTGPTAVTTQMRFGLPAAARLPAPLEALIGRRTEINQLAALLHSGRAVTVVGTGGMGKTQCALAFAHQYADDYPDRVWFFDLIPLQHAGQWLELLARALSIPASGEHELVERVARALADRRVLLVLDNCDRLSTVGGIDVWRRRRKSTSDNLRPGRVGAAWGQVRV
jgi:AAA domain